MLINLRNALMARLPYDAEVEYLESTGTQYIDTGVPNSTDVDISCNFSCDASGTASRAIFGAYSHTLAKQRMVSAYSGWNTTTARIGVYFGAVSFVYVTNNDVNNVTITGNKCYFNGSEIYSATNFTGSELTLWLFASNNVVSTYYPFTGRIYSCKIWQNGTLVRDFIPVRKGTVGYLYDRVSGRLFGNAGTGDFALGQDVVPVEYIESHGTEWIDTGIYSSANSKWVADFQSTKAEGATSQYIFGASGRPSIDINYDRTACGINTGNTGTFFILQGSNTTNGTSINTTIDFAQASDANSRHSYIIDVKNRKCALDGTEFQGVIPPNGSALVTNYTMKIFATQRQNSVLGFASGRLFGFSHYENDVLDQSLIPVRVGTDATSWEGAMMDVLTRRIYRNAGTGAFTYGNDLKYPIPAA